MTNFIQSQIRFTLHSEGTESYSWAWENLDRAQALKEIEEDGNDIVGYASGWAEELCDACLSQIDENGERGFSVEEITNDLIDDRHNLAAALQDWLEGDDEEDDEPEGDDDGDDDGDDQEPTAREMAEQGLLLCLGSLGGRGITPTGAIYVFSSYQHFVSQNPQWDGVQLPEPRWHGVTIVDDIDLPLQGGYQVEWGGNPTRKSDGYTYYPY